MLVDVVRMRQDGRRLTSAELREARPARGWLTVASGVASLRNDGGGYGHNPIPTMHQVHLHTLRDGQFVLHGIEPHPTRIGEEAIEMGQRQAWWVRINRSRPTAAQSSIEPLAPVTPVPALA